VPGIVLQSVSKTFAGGVQAVDDVSLEVQDGEFLVLVGPSGCGKSTLLRMIAGLETVSLGRIGIGDTDVTDLAPRARDIAMVFQDYALYPQMTVRENLGFGLKLKRTPRAEINQRVSEVANILGLHELLDRKPGALSGGQRQRVAIGRAIVREPKAFLMDEPLSNLDAKLRVGMRAELARLHARLGVTTIYVTHDQIEAMTLGQRVAVLRGGVLQQCATPSELFNAPVNLFVATFMGSPSMNLVEADVRDGRVSFAGIDVAVSDAGPDLGGHSRVIVGIRPTDFITDEWADPGLPRLLVKPDVVEDLGVETNVIFPIEARRVHVDIEPDEDAQEGVLLADDQRALFTARLPSRRVVESEVRLAIDVKQLYFFDPATGRALGERRGATPAPPVEALRTA
jgi:multiple sugar transport system ATP-binding protein